MWTVILNEDEEGRYVNRSEIRQALNIRFSQIASILIHLESKCFIHIESLMFSYLELIFHR